MDEVSVPVAAVSRFLSRVPPGAAAAVLVGCGFHDGISDTMALDPIVGVDAERQELRLESGASVSLKSPRLREAEIVDERPGAPLAVAMASVRTEAEEAAALAAQRLGRVGFDQAKLPTADAARAVLAMLDMAVARGVPDEPLVHDFYAAVRASGDPATALSGVAVLREVMAGCLPAQVPEAFHWQLTALLRVAGRWSEAVAASDILFSGRLQNPNARLLLATTRAAVMLDLAAVKPTPHLLDGAERALKLAYALERGDDLGALHAMRHRLNKLRHQ